MSLMSLRDAKNFTPHPVTIFLPSGKMIEFPSVGNCRAKSSQWIDYEYDFEKNAVYEAPGWGHVEQGKSGIVLVMQPPEWTGVDFVPHPPAQGESVIVSIVAAPALVPARPDLAIYVPDTGPESAVRDDTGRICGVKRLILWHDPEAGCTLKLVQPFNPANPGDGHRVLSRHTPDAGGLGRAVLDATGPFHEKDNLLIYVPWCNPIFIPDLKTLDQRNVWVRETWAWLLQQKGDHQRSTR